MLPSSYLLFPYSSSFVPSSSVLSIIGQLVDRSIYLGPGPGCFTRTKANWRGRKRGVPVNQEFVNAGSRIRYYFSPTHDERVQNELRSRDAQCNRLQRQVLLAYDVT